MFPSAIDLNFDNLFLDDRPAFDVLRDLNYRRREGDHFAAHNGLWKCRAGGEIRLPLNLQPLNRLPDAGAQNLEVRPVIHDGHVAVGDVRDVGRLIDDRHILLPRHWPLDAARAEVAYADERIRVGSDIIIIVGPILNTGAAIELRFGRQRCPADVIIAGAP